MEWCLSTSLDLALTLDVIVACATVAGVYIATRWRRQLRGTSEHGVKLAVLRGVLRLRQDIRGMRRPTLIPAPDWKWPEPWGPGNPHNDANCRQFLGGLLEMSRERSKVLYERRNELELTLLDAEAAFGDAAKASVSLLFEIATELDVNQLVYVGEVADPIGRDDTEMRQRWATIQASDQNDPFAEKLDAAVAEVRRVYDLARFGLAR